MIGDWGGAKKDSPKMARRKQAKTRLAAETPLFYPKRLGPSPSRSPLRSGAIPKATILGKVIFTWPVNVASSIHTAEWGSTNRSFSDQKKVLGGTYFHNPPEHEKNDGPYTTGSTFFMA
jgi:hypothetical protein